MQNIRPVDAPLDRSTLYVTRTPAKRRDVDAVLRALGWRKSRTEYYNPSNDFGRFLTILPTQNDGHVRMEGHPPKVLLEEFPCSINGIYVEPIVGDIVQMSFGRIPNEDMDEGVDLLGVYNVGNDLLLTGCSAHQGGKHLAAVRKVLVPASLMRCHVMREALTWGTIDCILAAAEGPRGITHVLVATSVTRHDGEFLVHADGRKYLRRYTWLS